MGTASIHEGIRPMRFSSLLDRTEAKELTQAAASELLGINVRTFQRRATRPITRSRKSSEYGFGIAWAPKMTIQYRQTRLSARSWESLRFN
jgi:hypothetical protein